MDLSTPTVPGVTEPAAYEQSGLPCIDDALAEPDPEKRGRKFAEIAKRWFEAWQWYYDECIETAAMLNGAQFGYWNAVEAAFIAEPETEDRDVVRVTANIEKRLVDQVVGMATQDDPIFGFAPGSSETGDSAAAEACDALARSIWAYHRRGDMLKRQARAAWAFGTGAELVEWDSSAGEPYVSHLEYPEPYVGEDGVPVEPPPKPVIAFKGDLRFTTMQRDQIAFDPVALHCYDGSALITRERMGRSRANALYPGKIKPASERSNGEEGGERRVERYSPVSHRDGTTDEDADEEKPLIVYRAFCRQTPTHPFGRTVVFTDAGDVLAERDNDAYPTKEEIARGEQWPNYCWPVVFFLGDERDNCPWGRGRLLDVHGLQKTINGDLSKGVQHRAIIGNTKIVLPKGLDVEWDDDIGQVIRGRPEQTQHIRYLIPPTTPSDGPAAIMLQRELAQFIAGVNDATAGTAPSSDPSGRAIAGLQQRDYVGLNPIKAGLYRSAAQMIELALRLFRRYAEQERKIVVVGKNAQTSVRHLDRSSIAAGTDVVAFNATALPQDPEKRAMYLMNLSTMLAQLKDDNQRNFILELLQLHDTQAWFEKQMPHRTRAVRMTRRLLLGDSPRAMPWDNPIVFKAAFEEFLCKEEVESQLEAEMAEAEKLAAQQPPMGLVPGMPPAAPAPPTPPPESLWARVIPLYEEYTQRATAALAPPPMPSPNPASLGAVPGAADGPPAASTQAMPPAASPSTQGAPAIAA